MGGGGGLGLFAGTLGARESYAHPAGRLMAVAAQVNAAPDVGGKSADGGGNFLRNLLEKMHPWLFLPYGHPKKTQKMKELQKELKPRLEGLARGFIEADKNDAKSWVIGKGAATLSRYFQRHKRSKD